MYLLPFELTRSNDTIALGNTFPKNEFFELHRVQISGNATIQILCTTGPILGTDITGQVTSSNAGETIFSGLFKVVADPKFNKDVYRLKVMKVSGTQDVVDDKDGIVFQQNRYILIKSDGPVVGNLLFKQPEGRRLV